MFKNTSGQKVAFRAIDTATGNPLTGDAANLTAYQSIDFAAVATLTDTSAAEVDATKAPGYYLFDLTQAETNGNAILFTAKSTTANVRLEEASSGGLVYTVPAAFGLVPGEAGGLFIAGTNAAVTITTVGGSALTLSSTGANGHGLAVSGNGSGSAVSLTAGATGNAIVGAGGSTSGDGIAITTTSGTALSLIATGTNKYGLLAKGTGVLGHGANFTGTGSGGHGANFLGNGGGNGVTIAGGATGNAMTLFGGATSGVGISITTTSGDGVSITPTAGHAIVATANGTSKHGFFVTGGTGGTSDGAKFVAGTGGVAINGAVKLTSDGLDAVIVLTSGGTLNMRQAVCSLVVGLGVTTGVGTTSVTASAPTVASPGTPGLAFTLDSNRNHTASTFTPPA